jgi:hypothetical protein
MTGDRDPRIELIYAESVRRLDQQAGVLESLRNRTGLLLGAAAVSTSFLGPIAVDAAGGLDLTGKLAIVCVVGASVGLGAILWPRTWRFGHKVRQLLDDLDGEPPRSIDSMHHYLSENNEDHYKDNEERLSTLFRFYEMASVLLGLSIAFWLFQLGGNVS